VLGPVLLFVGLIAGAIAAIGGIAVIGTILGVVAAIVALVAAFVIAYKQVGWFRRAVDAAVDAVTRFAKWLSNPQQVAKYRAAIQSVVDTVKTLVAWFQANLLPVVVDVWNRIVAVVASAVGFLRAHWDEIRAFAISTFDKILSAVKTWWSTMLSLLGVGWDVVRGVFTALWNVIVPIVTALVAVIKDHRDEIVAWTVKTFDQIAVIVTDVLDIVVRVFNFVFPILVGIVKAAMIVIGKIIEIALALIGWAWNTFGDDLVNVIVAVFTYIGRFISAALKVIGGIVKLVLALIQGDWSGAWDAIVQILGGVWDVITATIKLALTVIKSLLGAAWSIIKSAVGTVWDWIEGRISDAWNFIKDVLGGVKDWLKDHFVSAFEAVKTALKNVLEGIANVPRLAINFVIDFVWNKGIAAAINSIASKLGLGSPLGPIKTIDPFHFAKGGVVPGQRRGKNDTVPAMVRPGEGWLTPEAVDRLGGPKGLAALNKYGTLGGIGIPNPFPVIGKAAKTALGIAGQEALSTLDDLVHKVPWLGPFLSKVSAAKQTLTDKLAGSDLLGMAGIVLSKGGQLIGNVVKFAIEKAKAWVGTATGFSGSGGAAAAAAAHDRTIDASKWASPMVPGTYGITARWMSYPGHTGIDLAGSEGTPVYSAAPGRVSASYDLPGSDPRATYQGSINPYHSYGRVVEVDHGDGTSTLYGHLLQRLVTVGNMVSAASQIGNRGHYGYVLTSQGAPDYGAHLHFETHVGGTPVNPEPFMAERGAYFDRGGMLMPGQVGINQSGKPEPVLTGEQWSRLLSGLEAQKMPRRLAHVGVGGLSDGLPVGKVDARSQRFEFNWLAPNDERPSDEIVRKMEKLSRGGLFDGDDD
jgi:murein DD-endopeptidase MepM/ murein hydrolase activator NlpD